jgi:hypothetical protein
MKRWLSARQMNLVEAVLSSELDALGYLYLRHLAGLVASLFVAEATVHVTD